MAAALHLSGAEPKVRSKVEPSGDFCEGLATHQGRAQQRERVLLRIAVAPIELVPHHVTQKGITEKLEALVVACARPAPMGQREFKQRPIGKPITDPPFQGVWIGVDAGAARATLSEMRQDQSTFS